MPTLLPKKHGSSIAVGPVRKDIQKIYDEADRKRSARRRQATPKSSSPKSVDVGVEYAKRSVSTITPLGSRGGFTVSYPNGRNE